MFKSAMLSLCLSAALCGLAQASITVTGTGKIKYTPNQAHLHLGVGTESKTASEAWKKNAEAVKKVFDALKALGLADRDFQTSGVSVNPKYVHVLNQDPRLVGYVATYDLSVTVRKLDSLGATLDAAVEAGVNRNVGISFSTSDPEKLIDQARRAAVAEARKKAKLYAEGAGAALGTVKSISEGNASPWPARRFDLEARTSLGDRPLPIASGEQELSVSVTVTYDVVQRIE